MKRVRRIKLCECGCGQKVRVGRKWKRGHSAKNMNVSDENNPMFGRKHSSETKAKISAVHKGSKRPPRTDEYREKISEALTGREFSAEHRKKISIATKARVGGSGNPNWRGGIADDPYCPIFYDPEFKEIIFKRDNYECQNPLCRMNCNHLPLMPHHINYDKMDCDSRNIITVCWSCNSRANFGRKFWEKHYKSIMEER